MAPGERVEEALGELLEARRTVMAGPGSEPRASPHRELAFPATLTASFLLVITPVLEVWAGERVAPCLEAISKQSLNLLKKLSIGRGVPGSVPGSGGRHGM